eukprot:gene3121-3659_t
MGWLLVNQDDFDDLGIPDRDMSAYSSTPTSNGATDESTPGFPNSTDDSKPEIEVHLGDGVRKANNHTYSVIDLCVKGARAYAPGFSPGLRYRNEFGMHSIPGVARGNLTGSPGALLDPRPAYVVPVSKLYNAWHLLQSLIPAYVLLKRHGHLDRAVVYFTFLKAKEHHRQTQHNPFL